MRFSQYSSRSEGLQPWSQRQSSFVAGRCGANSRHSVKSSPLMGCLPWREHLHPLVIRSYLELFPALLNMKRCFTFAGGLGLGRFASRASSVSLPSLILILILVLVRIFGDHPRVPYRVDSNCTKVPLAHGISTSRSMNFELGFGVCLGNKIKIMLGLSAKPLIERLRSSTEYLIFIFS